MDLNSRTRFLFLFAAIAFGWIVYKKTSVQETKLPFGTKDLATVEHRLAKLPTEEARLVRAYVQRSNGDYMPRRGDPDNDFSARTFGDAIENQREFETRTATQAAKRKAERDARLAPLLAIAEAEVLSYELVSREAYESHRLGRPAPKSHVFGGDVVLSRVRLSNLGEHGIEAIEGSIMARINDNSLPVTLCYFKRKGSEIPTPGDSLDFDCAVRFGGWGREVMDADEGSVSIEWEPQYLKLANGRELFGR